LTNQVRIDNDEEMRIEQELDKWSYINVHKLVIILILLGCL